MNKTPSMFNAIIAMPILALCCLGGWAHASILDELQDLGVSQGNVTRLVVRGRVEPFPWPITSEVDQVSEQIIIWNELSSQERYQIWEHSAWRSIDFYVVGDEVTPTVTVDVNSTGEAHIRGKSPRSGGYASPGLLKWVISQLETRLDRIGSLHLQRRDGTTFLKGSLVSLDSVMGTDRNRNRSNAVLLPNTVAPEWHPVFRDVHYPGYLDACVTQTGGEYQVALIFRHEEHVVYLHGAREGNHVSGSWREWAGYCLTSRDVDKGVFELVLLNEQEGLESRKQR